MGIFRRKGAWMKKDFFPRLMVCGTGSGCGKTTVTGAILQAFRQRGISLAPYKCGPDYIDPMFHREITGNVSVNLDGVFLSPEKMQGNICMAYGRKTGRSN